MGLVKTVTLQITGEIRDAAQKIGLITKDVQALADKSPVELKAELTGGEQVKAKLAEIDANAQRLKEQFPEFTAKLNIAAATAKLGVLREELNRTNKAAADSGGGLNAFQKAIGGVVGAIGPKGGGGKGLIGSISALIGGAGAGAGLAGIVVAAGAVVGALTAAGLGLGAFGAIAIPILSNLKTQLGIVSTANDNFAAAAKNVNTAIHASGLDMKAYKDSFKGLPAGLQAAIKLLGDTGVTWQNLSKAQRDNVIAVSQNKDILKGLLPAQKTSLDALLQSKAAWEELTPAQQKASVSLHSISDAWGKLTKALEPDVLKIFNQGLQIAVKLLPEFLPFAKAAAGSISGLLKSFSDFVGPVQAAVKPMGDMSASTAHLMNATSAQKGAGFRDFLAQMQKLSGPAITALGQGLGRIAISLGKFLLVVSSPNSIKVLNFLLGLTAKAIDLLSWFIMRTSLHFVQWEGVIHHVANTFDSFRHNLAAWADRFAGVFIGAAKNVANWHDDVLRFFNRVSTAISNWARNAMRVFGLVKDTVKFLWDQVEIFTLRLVAGILDKFSHIPFIGHYFSTARDNINRELTTIEGDSRRSARNVQADWARIHGTNVALKFHLDFPPGIPAKLMHLHTGNQATGTPAAPPGLSWVGEEGPELVNFRGGETVWSAPRSRLLAARGFAAGTLDSFSDSFPSAGAASAMAGRFQRNVGRLGRFIRDLIGVLHFRVPGGSTGFPGGGSTGPGAAAAQAYARKILPLYGWGQSQFPPLQALWNQESGWRWNALNAVSGAYGIPQSLPASKMAAAGPDWRTNPATQIRWGLGYIRGRYGSPAGAEGHEQAFNWYDSGTQYLPTGPSFAMNATGRPERVGGEDLGPLLRKMIVLLERAPQATGAATGHATARALNGLAARVPAPRASSTRGR